MIVHKFAYLRFYMHIPAVECTACMNWICTLQDMHIEPPVLFDAVMGVIRARSKHRSAWYHMQVLPFTQPQSLLLKAVCNVSQTCIRSEYAPL